MDVTDVMGCVAAPGSAEPERAAQDNGEGFCNVLTEVIAVPETDPGPRATGPENAAPAHTEETDAEEPATEKKTETEQDAETEQPDVSGEMCVPDLNAAAPAVATPPSETFSAVAEASPETLSPEIASSSQDGATVRQVTQLAAPPGPTVTADRATETAPPLAAPQASSAAPTESAAPPAQPDLGLQQPAVPTGPPVSQAPGQVASEQPQETRQAMPTSTAPNVAEAKAMEALPADPARAFSADPAQGTEPVPVEAPAAAQDGARNAPPLTEARPSSEAPAGEPGVGPSTELPEAEPPLTRPVSGMPEEPARQAAAPQTGSEAPEPQPEQPVASPRTVKTETRDGLNEPDTPRIENGNATEHAASEIASEEPMAAEPIREAAPTQRAEAPAAAPPQPGPASVEPENVMSQIVRGAALRIQDGQTSMSLRLEPPSLGTVRLDLTMERDVIHVRIQVETEAVQQIVGARLPELREALAREGLDVQDVAFTLDEDSGASAFQQQARSSQEERFTFSSGQPSARPAVEDAPGLVPTPTRIVSGTTTVDFFA